MFCSRDSLVIGIFNANKIFSETDLRDSFLFKLGCEDKFNGLKHLSVRIFEPSFDFDAFSILPHKIEALHYTCFLNITHNVLELKIRYECVLNQAKNLTVYMSILNSHSGNISIFFQSNSFWGTSSKNCLNNQIVIIFSSTIEKL